MIWPVAGWCHPELQSRHVLDAFALANCPPAQGLQVAVASEAAKNPFSQLEHSGLANELEVPFGHSEHASVEP